jgi:acetyltransferase
MFTPLKYLPPELLAHLMDVDYDRRMALVATIGPPDSEEFVGVARYAATDVPKQAEIGVTVTDAWQHRGIATLLMQALMRFAEERGFEVLTGVVVPENYPMLELARRLGFELRYDTAEHVMKIRKVLHPAAKAAASDSSAESASQ